MRTSFAGVRRPTVDNVIAKVGKDGISHQLESEALASRRLGLRLGPYRSGGPDPGTGISTVVARSVAVKLS